MTVGALSFHDLIFLVILLIKILYTYTYMYTYVYIYIYIYFKNTGYLLVKLAY